MSSGYSILPEIYDRWQKTYGKDYSTLILPRVLSTIRRFDIPVSSMLDLACGTGTLMLMMARRGWHVWGVDGSAQMIAIAAAKLKKGKRDGQLLRQDMRELRLTEPVGLVTCLFDSLNHLPTESDLFRTFQAIHETLHEGGYFIFDLNNELCFKTLWRQTETIHHREFTMILQNSYDAPARSATSNVTLFLKKGQQFEKQTEAVRERYFPGEEVESLLRRAGFSVLESEDFNFTPIPQVGKIKTWWVARKGEERG